MVLDRFCPWKGILMDTEVENGCAGLVKFVLYSDYGTSWRVGTVPPKSDSFDMRVPLFAEWRGLRDQELAEKSGIHDITFVHGTGFTGGAISFESALKMAKFSLDAHKANGGQ